MRRALVLFGVMGLCWSFAPSCAFDEREVQLVQTNLGVGGASGEAGKLAGASGAMTEAGPIAPRLDVSATAIDLGRVATNYPSRARVFLTNGGDLPLPAPAVTWTTGGEPDFTLIQNQ